MQPRWYQTECAKAMLADVFEHTAIHPVGALPTGTGKSLTLCLLVDGILSRVPEANILVLSHDSKILEQDHEALTDYFLGFDICLHSAGLGFREKGKITVAGIQSIYKKASEFQDVKFIIIDEAHKIPFTGFGQYRQFLRSIHAQYMGLTATPYRYGNELIYGEIDYTNIKSPMFNRISYDATYGKKFNRLIDEGYLSPLIIEETKLKLDTKDIKIVNGDFSKTEMAHNFDRVDITNQAIAELLPWKDKYKKWMVFAIDTVHSDHIAETLNANGVSAVSIHSKSKTSDEDFHKFKTGKVQVAVSVEKMTTGVNVPDIDLIAMLRPTRSPVIHVQTAGRGTRISPDTGKTHCAFFDFAGNTERLGPINDISVTVMEKKKKKRKGAPIYKTCENCGKKQHPAKRKCVECDHPFEFKESLTKKASNSKIIKSEIKTGKHWLKVDDVLYSIHSRKGVPSSLKVEYECNGEKIDELIKFSSKGFNRYLAENWIKHRAPKDAGLPKDVSGLYRGSKYLKRPVYIMFDYSNKKIIDSKFDG